MEHLKLLVLVTYPDDAVNELGGPVTPGIGYQCNMVSSERYIHCHVTTFRNFHSYQLGQNAYYGVRQKNEMNRALGHLCAHIGYTGPGEPPDDGEMIEMTLSSRHRIRNSSPGGLRPSTLPLTEAPHNTDFHTWMGKKQFLFLSNRRDREPNSGVKGSGITTTLGPRHAWRHS